MIAVDTNILIYAHREESPFFPVAEKRLTALAEGQMPWALPWPCLHEFFSIVTHPRIFQPPTPLQAAVDQVDAWLSSPSVVLLAEGDEYWAHLRLLLETGLVTGPKVHDARIAAICTQHGVSELWTADRDFSRYPSVTIVNPLI